MPKPQIQPAFGKKCRRAGAAFAGPLRANDRTLQSNRFRQRLPLFAQFPPKALFAAIRRAAMRGGERRQIASGTALAMSRLWHATGGP
jgi:hypothetical protein